MKFHELKCWPSQFASVECGLKRFEIRRDDRDFQVRDAVLLREFVPDDPKLLKDAQEELENWKLRPGYTGRESRLYRITYVERSKCIPEGFCGFGLVPLRDGDWT